MTMQIYQFIEKKNIKMLSGKILRRGKLSPVLHLNVETEGLCAFLYC